MLHPSQFEVNEAWIAFQLNDAPVRTDQDGAFNCIGLMDAASCFLFDMVMVAVGKSGYLEKALKSRQTGSALTPLLWLNGIVSVRGVGDVVFKSLDDPIGSEAPD